MPLLESASPTPSVRGGVPPATEAAYRAFGADLLSESGQLLRLPRSVIAAGQCLLHRFLFRKSLLVFDVHLVVLAALYLGAKAEEAPRSVRSVLTAVHAVRARRWRRAEGGGGAPPFTPLVLGGRLYNRWKEQLLAIERHMLKELGFAVYASCETPHAFLPTYVRTLGGGAELAQGAWAAANEAGLCVVCVQHPPEAVACAAVLIGARLSGTSLPSLPWAELFAGRSADATEALAEEILRAVSEAPAPWLPSLRPEARVEDEED